MIDVPAPSSPGEALVLGVRRSPSSPRSPHGGRATRAGESCAWTIGVRFLRRRVRADALDARAVARRHSLFDRAAIALPMLIATAALAVAHARGARGASLGAARIVYRTLSHRRSRGQRACCTCSLAWLALRFATCCCSTSLWQPLYPWDAWIQWATKARVWYALGHIVPFGRTDAVVRRATAHYGSTRRPNYPATVPLWQVWSSVALGRWDDALMNLPWWLIAVAFAIAMYGALRHERSRSARRAGRRVARVVAAARQRARRARRLRRSADGAYYTLAALATWRWSLERTVASALLASCSPSRA